MDDKEVNTKTKKEIELIDVVTATEKRIQLPDGTVMGVEEYLVWLGNKIINIGRSVG